VGPDKKQPEVELRTSGKFIRENENMDRRASFKQAEEAGYGGSILKRCLQF
jgi:hypothetical protein